MKLSFASFFVILTFAFFFVIPTKVRIKTLRINTVWNLCFHLIPAFAGMTSVREVTSVRGITKVGEVTKVEGVLNV